MEGRNEPRCRGSILRIFLPTWVGYLPEAIIPTDWFRSMRPVAALDAPYYISHGETLERDLPRQHLIKTTSWTSDITCEESELTSYKTQPKEYMSDLSEALIRSPPTMISGAIQCTGLAARPTRVESRYLPESEAWDWPKSPRRAWPVSSTNTLF